jgi:hypothetical protein
MGKMYILNWVVLKHQHFTDLVTRLASNSAGMQLASENRLINTWQPFALALATSCAEET